MNAPVVEAEVAAPPVLAASGLCKRYPVGGARLFSRRAVPLLHAVDRVSLAVGAGETVGLVGESGCGKTTLTRMLARLIDTTEGEILFAGEDLAAVPAARFARHPARASIQMVFQDAEGSINPRFTAADAIAAPLRRLKGLRGAPLAAAAERAADRCGLPRALLGRFPHQLSGGQKARVGIARAIATEPRLLILDEPTSALDPIGRRDVRDIIRHLKSVGKTVFLNSHLLSEVEMVCDEAAIVNHGRVLAEGALRDLLGRRELDLRIGAPSNGLMDELSSRWKVLSARGGMITLEIASDDEAADVADVVTRHGVRLYHLTPQRASLEELFVRVVSEAERGRSELT